MEVNERNIEVFDAYLRGGMTAQEAADFKNRLAQNPDFSVEFEAYKQLVSGMNEHFRSELKQELKAVDAEMDLETSKEEPSGRSTLIWLSAGVAASLLIGLFAYSFFGPSDSVKLAEQYWPVEEGLPVKMSTKSPYDEAMNAFKLEQWPEAERHLNALPESDTTAYFLGNVYFKQAQFNEAASAFQSVSAAAHWHAEAQFRLALTYLAQEQTAEAKTLLQKIADADTPFSADATAVLEEI